jgi:hypothetical protein
MREQRVCVLYHYYELDASYAENLLHFILFGYRPDVTFYIIISGKYSIALPKVDNIIYVYTDNRNYDYGGYSIALREFVDIDGFDYFIFVNSSVRGPYLPAYFNGAWVSPFIALITDEVGVSGSTINIIVEQSQHSAEFQRRHGGTAPFSHVQSMAYCLSQSALSFLQADQFFACDRDLDKLRVITDYEMLLSQKLIRAGWNIKCLLPEYNVVDYRKAHGDINPTSARGEAIYEGSYFGRTAHPFETIFTKTNRALYPFHFFDKLTYSMIQSGIPLPRPAFTPSIEQYLQSKMSTEGFSATMPTNQDKIAHAKLLEIIRRTNEILQSG